VNPIGSFVRIQLAPDCPADPGWRNPLTDPQELFNKSYERTVAVNPGRFFERFYQFFFAADPRVAELFGDASMERQKEVLEISMGYVIDYAVSKRSTLYVGRLAQRHGPEEIGVPSELFDTWLECLLDAVREQDPGFDPDVESAWRTIMEPCITFMKSHCQR
jgi:truncated hemoglobin YjbI